MAKCIVCGRKLVTEQSISIGIGSECLRKAHKSGTVSNRVTAWQRRVQRTIGFARGSFEIGNTKYKMITSGCWSDNNGHLYTIASLSQWLEQNKQIVLLSEISDEMLLLLQSGKSVEEILKDALDKNENL